MDQREFRSPLRKLVVFFEKSRDKWKQKCQQAKYELKLLKRRLDNLQNTCGSLRHRCQQAQTQCEQLQAQRDHLHQQQQKLLAQVQAFSKKGAPKSQLDSIAS